CHDHKFEPIPQRDFYRLEAFFAPAAFRRDLAIPRPEERQAHEAGPREYTAPGKPIQDALAPMEGPKPKRLYQAKIARRADEARLAHLTPEAERNGGQKELVEQTARLLVVTPQEIAAALSNADKAKYHDLQEQLRKFDDRKPAPLPVAMGLQDGVKVAKTF